jgi:glutamyl-tRNA synthetase
MGSALAAIFGWAIARRNAGTFILRIEDIDRTRCRREHEDTLLADLDWLGLEWDEGPDVGGPHGPYRQSERLDHYDAVLVSLLERGLVYRCRCSRADLRQSAPHLGLVGEPPEVPYAGTCRHASHAALAPQQGGLRLAIDQLPSPERTWIDALRGPSREDLRVTCGDFLLGRPQHPTYQLAVVADDRAMGITDVVRGRDLSGSTARQLALHAALGGAPPTFWHHPLIVDASGRKLSKRDEAPPLASLRGAAPTALIAGLGRAIGLFARDIRQATARDFADALDAPHRTTDGFATEVTA